MAKSLSRDKTVFWRAVTAGLVLWGAYMLLWWALWRVDVRPLAIGCAIGFATLLLTPWHIGIPGGPRAAVRAAIRVLALVLLAFELAVISGTWTYGEAAVAVRDRDYARANELLRVVERDFSGSGFELRRPLSAKVTPRGLLWVSRTSVYYDLGVNSYLMGDTAAARTALQRALEEAALDGRSATDVAAIRYALEEAER